MVRPNVSTYYGLAQRNADSGTHLGAFEKVSPWGVLATSAPPALGPRGASARMTGVIRAGLDKAQMCIRDRRVEVVAQGGGALGGLARALHRVLGLLGDAEQAGGAGGHRRHALSGVGDAAAHLGGGRGLLLDGRGDAGLVLVDLVDDRADRLDRGDGAGRLALDVLHPTGHLLGGLAGALRELLDLAGHHGEPLARLARPGSLDGGVEGEQVGLLRDAGDCLLYTSRCV